MTDRVPVTQRLANRTVGIVGRTTAARSAGTTSTGSAGSGFSTALSSAVSRSGGLSTKKTVASSTSRSYGAASSASTRYDAIIKQAARREGVDESLLKAVVEAESSYNAKAVSPVGAKGLMQLMDGTARSLGVKDSFDPSANIAGGAKYLRQQLDRFGSVPLALAAYNAGPGAVEQYGGVPPYAETQNYIENITRIQQRVRGSMNELQLRGR